MKIKNKKYGLLGKVLEILENDFTKGEIELTSFSIEDEHRKKLKELEDKRFFKKYTIFLGDNSFRIEAIPLDKKLENNLLMFDRLNLLFEKIPIETGIACGGGLFLFTFNKTDEDLDIKIEFDFSEKELLKEIVKMIEDIHLQIKISHNNKTSDVNYESYWKGYANGLGASIIDHIYPLIEFITKKEIKTLYDQLEWSKDK